MKGYRWVILVVCFLMLLINSGIVLSFGLFLKPLTLQFGLSVTHISVVLAAFMLFQGLFSPYIGSMIDRFGPRKIIIIGIMGFGTVLTLTSQMTAFWQFALLYGLLGSIAYTTTTLLTNAVLISGWFTENRGLALGISMSGFPLGPLAITPIMTHLLLKYDWRTAVLTAAGGVLLFLFPLVAVLLRDGPGHIEIKESLRKQPKQLNKNDNAAALSLFSLMKDPRYRRLAGAYFTCGFSMALIMAHFHNFGQSLGFEVTTTAQAYSIMGLLAFMGTIASGRLSDILERKYVLALIYFLRGVSFLVMALASNLIMFYLGAIIFGIFWTATGPLTSALSSECWGLKNMGRTFGAVFLSHQIGASIGPILGGLTFDLTGSYFLIYVLTAIILITGSFGVRGLKPTVSPPPLKMASPITSMK
jgi:MFS family permease